MVLSIAVYLSLQRQKCFLFFCWWSTEAANSFANVATLARTNASQFCKRGWWRGSGFHTAVYPNGTNAVAWTRNTTYIYC
jgi:hypothetical protein